MPAPIVLFWVQMAITAASIVYQRYRARKLAAASAEAADAQKGMQLVSETTAAPLFVAYGRNKLGGIRVDHKVAADYIYAAPHASGDMFLSTGDSRSPFPGSLVTITAINASYKNGEDYESASSTGLSITGTFALTTMSATMPTAIFNSGNLNLFAHYVGLNVTLTYDGVEHPVTVQTYNSTTGDTVFRLSDNEIKINTPSLNTSVSNTKREFMFIQQAICMAGIHKFYWCDVDDKSFNLSDYEYGLRIHVYPKGSIADPLATANGFPATNVFTDVAYATIVARYDRETPNFSNIPNATFYVEGQEVYDIEFSLGVYSLSATKTYSNNPARCLLDYLMSTSYGKGLSLSEIDLASFYKAKLVCERTVETAKPINGKLWTTKGGPRNVKIYECNLGVDTGRTLRDNIETILETMNGAELVWSAGRYKLQLDYPIEWVAGTYPYDTIVQYISGSVVGLYRCNNVSGTSGVPDASPDWVLYSIPVGDNDIDTGSAVSTVWPKADQRLNFCTVKFSNESNDFAEDSVSWPPKSGGVYTTFLAEDSGIVLEKDFFLSGCTTIYHALAAAEQAVRKSRSDTVYNFKLLSEFGGVEPADFLVMKSNTYGIDNEILKIEQNKITEEGFAEIQSVSFDARQLAWNAKDDEIVAVRNVYTGELLQATSLAFTPTGTKEAAASGVLSWSSPVDNRIRSYKIMYTEVTRYEVHPETVWYEIGRTSDLRFDTPKVTAGKYTLSVVALDFDGKAAPKWSFTSNSRWPVIECVVPLDPGISSVTVTAAPGQIFVTDASSTVTPSTITLTATTTITTPLYEWYEDGALLTGETASTLVVSSFAPTADKVYKCVVHNLLLDTEYDTISIFSLQEGSDGIMCGLENEDQSIQCTSLGVPIGAVVIVSKMVAARGASILASPDVSFTVVRSVGIESAGITTGGSANVSINSTTGIISVTAIYSEFASVDFKATIGTVEFIKTLTLHKTRAGQNAEMLMLVSSSIPAFVYDTSTSTTSTYPTISFTARLIGVTGTATWTAEAFTAAHVSLGTFTMGGSGNVRTVTSTQFNSLGALTTDYVDITASIAGSGGTLTDNMTIYKAVADGSAARLYLFNRYAPANNNVFTYANTTVQVYVGVTDDTAAWSFAITPDSGVTATINGGAGPVTGTGAVTLAVTAMTPDVGRVLVTATKGALTVTDYFTVSKSMNGTGGNNITLDPLTEIVLIPNNAGVVTDYSAAWTNALVYEGATLGTGWTLSKTDVNVTSTLTGTKVQINSILAGNGITYDTVGPSYVGSGPGSGYAYGNGVWITPPYNTSNQLVRISNITPVPSAAITSAIITSGVPTVNWGNSGRTVAFGSNVFLILQAGTTSFNYIYSTDYGLNWVTGSFPSSGQYHDIYFAGGTFVVRKLGSTTAYTSTTGLTGSWSSVTLPVASDVTNYIVYNNGVTLFHSGYGSYYRSINSGATWTTIADTVFPITLSVSSYIVENMEVISGYFIAILQFTGPTNKIMVSKDGLIWSSITMPELSMNYVGRMYIGNKLYLNSGYAGSPYPIMASSNGINWTAVTPDYSSYSDAFSTVSGVMPAGMLPYFHPALTQVYPCKLVDNADGTGYVDLKATKSGETDLTKRLPVRVATAGSATYTFVLSNAIGTVTSLVAGGPAVDFSKASTIITVKKGTQDDTNNWLYYPTGYNLTFTQPSTTQFNVNGFGGGTSSMVYNSAVNITYATSKQARKGCASGNTVIFTQYDFSGTYQTILWRSTDGGITFSSVTIPGGTWGSLDTDGAGTWICVEGQYATWYTSARTLKSTDNGATWALGGALPFANDWHTIKYGNGKWIACCASTGGSGSPAVSTNGGTSWSTLSWGFSPDRGYLAYGNGTWMMSSAGGHGIYRSTNNGVTWSQCLTYAEAGGRKIFFVGNKFILGEVSGGTIMKTTVDGSVWTSLTVPTSQTYGFAYCNGKYFSWANGEGYYLVSGDAVTWTRIDITVLGAAHGTGTPYELDISGSITNSTGTITIPIDHGTTGFYWNQYQLNVFDPNTGWIDILARKPGETDVTTRFIVNKIAMATDAYALVSLPSNWQLPSEANGFVTSYAGAVFNLSVTKNGIVETGWTFASTASTGLTITGGTTAVVTLTAITNAVDTGTITVTATKANNPAQTFVINITKLKKGDVYAYSANPGYLSIPSTKDGVVTNYAPAVTTARVDKNGTDDTANWSISWTITGGVTPASGTGATVTVTNIPNGIDQATINFTATKANMANVTGMVPIVKNKSGVNSGPVEGAAYSKFSATATYIAIKFTADGQFWIKIGTGGSWQAAGDWYLPNGSYGSTIWIQCRYDTGSSDTVDSGTSDVLDTWLPISTDRIWALSASTAGLHTVNLAFLFATSAAGANASIGHGGLSLLI